MSLLAEENPLGSSSDEELDLNIQQTQFHLRSPILNLNRSSETNMAQPNINYQLLRMYIDAIRL